MVLPGGVFWVVLGLFNVALAALLFGVKQVRRANLVAGALVATNGIFGIVNAIRGNDDVEQHPIYDVIGSEWDVVLNLPVFAAFVVLPFLFPRRRPLGRAEALLIGGAIAWVLVLATLVLRDPDAWHNNFGTPHTFWFLFAPYFLGLMLGTWNLTDTYLHSPSPIQQTQARFLLAAYLLKVGTYLQPLAFMIVGIDPTFLTRAVPQTTPATFAVVGIFAAAAFGFLLMMGAARLRARRGPSPDDLFLLAFCVLGLAIYPLRTAEMEFMLLRPLLITYALLRYQMLDVDLRDRRGTVVAVAIAGMASLHLTVVLTFSQFGAPASVSTGLGVVALLVLGGLLAFPLLRVLLLAKAGAPAAAEPRARDLYRAALEGVVADGGGDTSSGATVLRALRDRLGISEREHAAMEASVRTAFNRPSRGLAPGAKFLDRYTIERLLGEGGFGRTFLALDDSTGRKVVLKVARADSEEEGQRMLREAKHLARLQHPNIVTLYDVERVGDDVILVLEYVEGGSLAQRLEKGKLPPDQAAAIVDDVLAALEAAHAEDVLHRDVKPANILLTKEGRAKLADFGVARAGGGGLGTASGLSITGVQPGSVHYMSPEQVRGLKLDERSDLYSAAAVLYECLAGRPYLDFRGQLEFDARLAVLEQEPKLPLAGVPKRLNDLLRAALAKDRGRRTSVADVRRQLRPLAAV